MTTETTTTAAAEAALLAVLGRIPSGIFILTARRGQDETGMLASWVMQAAFHPPGISVAVAHGRYLADWLSEGSPFVLNVVAEHQKGLLKHFGRGFPPGSPAFEGLELLRDPRGVAILAEGTLGHLCCNVRSYADSGDHRLFIADVIEGQLTSEAAAMVHHRKSGAHY
jgi:flavin reductase (DIM6/NTAB) family NADH-FMN oxidoreductase RutF